MLVDAVAFDEATTSLESRDFSLDSHRRIFAAMLALSSADRAVDLVTLIEELRCRKELDSVGGYPYLASLTEDLPQRLNVEEYVRIVREKSGLRDLLTMGQELSNSAADQSIPSSDLVDQVRTRIDEIAEDSSSDSPMESFGEYLEREFPQIESVFDPPAESVGVSSGFPWWDMKTGGLAAGRLYVFAARPSIGKTALAANMASHIALRGDGGRPAGVAKFTFEQDKRELKERLLCGRARASLKDFRDGRSDRMDRDYIKAAMKDFRDAPLYWDDTPGMTSSRIRAKLKRLKTRMEGAGQRLKVAIIDQLSFISRSDVAKPGMRGDEQIGAITRALKKMARELGIAVVLLCQLSRPEKGTVVRRPMLTDLKNSGSIEEDADVVTLLHRQWFYSKADKALEGKGEFLLEKQRQGPTGRHVVEYNEKCCLWEDKWEARDAEDDQELFA